MSGFIRNWFARRKAAQDANDRLLELKREAQTLRLELEEREQTIATLRGDLERTRRAEKDRIDEARREAIERFLAEAAGPAAQLLTQRHLSEIDGKPVAVRDIMLVGRHLIQVLENDGLVFEGKIGERVSFDPDRHTLLGGAGAASPGQQVIVRIPGASYHGRILRKAIVETAGG